MSVMSYEPRVSLVMFDGVSAQTWSSGVIYSQSSFWCKLFLTILRWRFAYPLDDARVGDRGDGLINPVHLDLMIPVVAEVEPIAEHALYFQVQFVQRGRASVAASFSLREPFFRGDASETP